MTDYYKLLREKYDGLGVEDFWISNHLPREMYEYVDRNLPKEVANRYCDYKPFTEQDWDEIKKLIDVFNSPLNQALL